MNARPNCPEYSFIINYYALFRQMYRREKKKLTLNSENKIHFNFFFFIK